MKIKIYDKESNEPIDDVEIPDNVLSAAHLVAEWLENQGDVGIELCGLKLAD